jgi:thioredoxin reductase (NADPH)
MPGGRIHIATSAGTRLDAGAVVIAAGVGSFQPRRLALQGIEQYEGRSVHCRVKSAADFHGQNLVICGGGDSALDWTVALCEKARSLTLVHRREEFRAAPATVQRMRDLVAAGKMQLAIGHAVAIHGEGHQVSALVVQAHDGQTTLQIAADQVLAFYGLHPKLGPVADWGLELEKKALKVDTEKFQTSVPGIFAIGDINTYPGKKKLILSGFHEAALAAFAIQHHLFPEKRQFLQYTTTSPIMQKRLGVGEAH